MSTTTQKPVFTQRQNWGKHYFYPENESARLLCEFARTDGKSLSARQIELLIKLGLKITIQAAGVSPMPQEPQGAKENS